MTEDPKKQLVQRITRNFLDILVLRLIQAEPMWGYKIIKKTWRLFGIKLRHGALYPLLNSLETEGYAESEKITKEGLTLRLYPTSYPSSSAGGWLAQGGAGIGSYEYGYFKENVISARVVLPDGNVKEFKGDQLDVISDAEGITGFITEVTVRVQPDDELDIMALGCPDAHDAQELVESIINAELPVWSIVFINPRMAEMKNRAPVLEHQGHPVEEKVMLPAAYILTLAYKAKDKQRIFSKIEELISKLKKKYTIIIVTHNMQQAARISDYTGFMYLGKMIEFGKTEQIFENPKEKLTENYITGRFG